MRRIISYYALSESFKAKLSQSDGDQYSCIAELRNLGLRKTFWAIRALRADQLLIAIETDNARPLAVPLMVIGALSGSPKMEIVWPDTTRTPLKRLEIFSHLYRILAMQFSSRVAYRRAKFDIRRYQKGGKSVDAASSNHGAEVMYLDANLSFGLVAGGSLGHTRGVIDAMAKRGYKVTYASVKAIPTDAPNTTWQQLDPPNLYAFPPELNYYSFNEQYETRVQELARDIQPAFFYQRMSLHNFSGARLRERLKIPVVLEYNGSEAWTWENWGKKLALHDAAIAAEKMALCNADLVVTVSDALARNIEAVGVPSERIVVYPNCIDPEIFDPNQFAVSDLNAIRARWNIQADAKIVTFIGTFGQWHGVDFMASAMLKMAREMPEWLAASKLHFLLIGDGMKMPDVRRLLSDSAIADRVTLTGLIPQQEAPAYLAVSDMFVSPHMPNQDGSAFFGSPTKLFEYMAMERPIIASDLDQIGDVLRDVNGNDLAYLFEPGDTDAFICALRSASGNPTEAKKLAVRARAEVLARYAWTNHVDAILTRMERLGLIPTT